MYVIETVNSSHCCGLVDCHTHQHFGKGSWDHGGTVAFQHLKEMSPASSKIHHLPAFLAFFFSNKIHQRIFIVALSDRVTIGTSVLGLWIFPPWETLNHKVLQPFSTSGLVERCIRYPCMHLEFLGIFCTTMSHETSPVGWLIYEGVCYLTKHGVTKAMIQVAISTHDSFLRIVTPLKKNTAHFSSSSKNTMCWIETLPSFDSIINIFSSEWQLGGTARISNYQQINLEVRSSGEQ